ncbi:MAG TPA: FkbM family methyltransferase [Bacteroidia bacterium]|nr:FkbM family methyltransferase [Bacteroidia bacterium]HQF27345.1 FkbM family methyltransferase [Bacteroidia bacterium]HQK96578.1 FkbM family methyltransferase [Bacteroidia bacterium]
MIGKVISHLKDGDLLHVAKNYLNNFSANKRISEWRKLKGETDSVKIELGDNTKLKLYTDSVLSETIYVGRFENAELDFVKRYLRKGDVFMDIGANIGLFTTVGASKVGAGGKVYSFEPVKKTYSRLEENVNINSFANVSLFNAGLSNSDGELEMTTSAEGFDAWNSFGKPTAGSNFIKEKVSIFKIDSWTKNQNVSNVNLAKIDVEGWECNVMIGGESFFSAENAPDLLVEFTEENCKNAGFTCAGLYDILAKYGYQMFLFDEARKKLIPEAKRKVYTHINIVATKNPDRVSQRIK